MQMTTPTTRRRALGRMGIALAGVIGVGAGGAAALRGTRPAGTIDADGRLLLHAAGLRNGSRTARSPSSLDERTPTPSRSCSTIAGTSIGTFRTATGSAPARSTPSSFPRACCSGSAPAGAGGETSHAVVGGTGRYAGATGTYSIAPAPELPGRSLTFAFTLILPTPEA